MALYVVGEYLREIRIRKGYSQEAVCYNICTSATLSRIENGHQYPGKRMIDKLLERLGVETEVFDLFVNAEELETYELIQMMSRNIATSNMKELERQIKILESLPERRLKSEKQYLLWAKGVFEASKGSEPYDVYKIFMEALYVTLPEFDGENPLKNKLLTYDEILLINGIAVQYAKMGKIAKAIRLGMWLKEYMEEKTTDGKMKAIKYPAITYDLSNWYGKAERYYEALEMAEAGISYCINYGNITALPLLLFNKACAISKIDSVENAEKYYRQSITIFEVTNQYDKAQMVIDWCEKQYQILF